MTIQLTLPADQQSELEQRAAAAGVDPVQYVLAAIQEKLVSRDWAAVEKEMGAQTV